MHCPWSLTAISERVDLVERAVKEEWALMADEGWVALIGGKGGKGEMGGDGGKGGKGGMGVTGKLVVCGWIDSAQIDLPPSFLRKNASFLWFWHLLF